VRASGDAIGALHGLPIPVKDSVNSRALPTSNGTRALRDFRPRDDAGVLKSLLAQGGILMGKTNIHAAVAARMAPLAVAEDTLGSIRVPATMCGLAGLRPSFGRYPICLSTIARDAIMAFSLYAATVPSYRQILGAVSGLLGTAEAFSTEKGIAPDDIIQARLAEDMLPFAYQVKSTAVHSLGAIEGVRRGVFSPDVTRPPDNFAALKARIAATLAALETIEASEVDAFVGRDMRFTFGERHVDFTAENFLLSFSQPNFYFHATTTYAILRWKGIPLGKRDFTGKLRLKR